MNWELAKRLKDAKFPQGMYPNSQYYIAPNVIIERKDIFTSTYHDNPKEARTSNEFVYKPTYEDLIVALNKDMPSYEDLVNEWLQLHE